MMMEKWRDLVEKCRKRLEEAHQQHEEFHRRHEELDERHQEFHRWQYELHRQSRELRKSKAEFHRLHRHIRFSTPLILIITFFIWYLIFRYAGFKVVITVIAGIVSTGGIYEFFFLRRIEKRILAPIDKLKDGVEEIAKGNYQVTVESDVTNEISILIDSFNEMARKLQEGERLKAQYEENRKMLIVAISHDLKTPITSIQGYIEAITEGETITEGNSVPPENINKYLKIIKCNAEYLNKLIDDLFLFSKLDMEKLDFQFENVLVRPFFQDMMEEFKLEFEEKPLEFIYTDKLETSCSVSIDRKRIHQVLRNIIDNAVKYGPEQGLVIKAELSGNKDFVSLDIKDNGAGIPEDKLPHVFGRFYRIDDARGKDLVSTGLGLAIAKELVEAHDGRIRVSNLSEVGTCFTIMIPVLQ